MILVNSMQEQRGEGGITPKPDGEGESPPEQARTSFLRGLIQEMGGNPQDLSSPPPHRETKREEGDNMGWPGRDQSRGGCTNPNRWEGDAR